MPLLWPHRNGHSAGGGPGGQPGGSDQGDLLGSGQPLRAEMDRNIRTAVQIAWRTNPELLREMAGYPLDGPPTASEFLEILSNDVQRAMERREEGVSSTPGI